MERSQASADLAFVRPVMNVIGVLIVLAATYAWVYEPGYDLTE